MADTFIVFGELVIELEGEIEKERRRGLGDNFSIFIHNPNNKLHPFLYILEKKTDNISTTW